MLTRKIIIFFILVAAKSFAFPEFSSLSRQRVFPDDEHWPPIHARHEHGNSKNEASDPGYKICETKECKIIGKEFLSSLNKSVDPCDDFYDFACSGWPTDAIPPSVPFWSRYMIFKNTVDHRVKEILETEIEPSDLLPIRQAKKWYRSCMDADTLEDRGVRPIESILIRAGGWPIAMDEEEWDSEGNTWQSVERYYARLFGEYTFYGIRASAAFREDDEYGIVGITIPTLPLSDKIPTKYRNYSGNDYEQYLHLVTETAELFVRHNHADVSKKKITEEAKEIVAFEKEIFELEDNRGKWEEMTVEEFYDWYDTNVTEEDTDSNEKIPWKSLVEELFDPMNIKVNPASTMFVEGLEYVKNIGKLLAKTPRRTIVNYIHWRFVANMLPYTTEEMREKLFQFISEEFGVKERPERWSECVDDMEMEHAAAYEFVNKYFTNHTKKTALEMIKNIQTAMEAQIENSNWLDTESKEWATDKLRNLKIFAGFPDWYKNKTALVNYYKGLNIGSEYFENALSYMRYSKKKEIKRYTERDSDDPGWQMDPITINALYVPEQNYLNVPAADFQAPLFTPQLPDNVNYGIVGVIVGHEMGHGFDDTGIFYGKSPNASTLSKDVLKNFYQRADCFLDQYDDYFSDNSVDESEGTTEKTKYRSRKKSMITRGENMADTTGIQSVFQAYHNLKKPEGGDLRLPGLEEFTDDQMFFVSFASTWCQIVTPQFAKKQKESMDPHSPAKYRVLGSVSNTKAFAEVFNCPVGSPMNPTNKCNIWQKSSGTTETPKSLKKHHGYWKGQWKV